MCDNVFNRIIDASNDIVGIALNCHVGIPRTRTESKLDTLKRKQHEIFKWSRHEQWLLNKTKDIEHRRKENIELIQETTGKKLEQREAELTSSIKKLQQKLLSISYHNFEKETLLHKAEEVPILNTILHNEERMDILNEHIKMLCNKRDVRSKEVLKANKLLLDLKKRHRDISIRNVKIRATNRSLWKKLKEKEKRETMMIERSESEGVEKLKKQETKLLQEKNMMLRAVLQKIVLESGLNWARDPCLLDIILDKIPTSLSSSSSSS